MAGGQGTGIWGLKVSARGERENEQEEKWEETERTESEKEEKGKGRKGGMRELGTEEIQEMKETRSGRLTQKKEKRWGERKVKGRKQPSSSGSRRMKGRGARRAVVAPQASGRPGLTSSFRSSFLSLRGRRSLRPFFWGFLSAPRAQGVVSEASWALGGPAVLKDEGVPPPPPQQGPE